jgi:serine/threonine protein kinase
MLCSGAYGTVCAVRDEASQEVVAIKKCKKIFDSKTLTKRALREIRLLRHISHPNIVSLKKVLFPPTDVDFNEIYLMFELMDTDLAQIIKSSQKLRLEHIQYFSYQLLSALEFLHSANIIHRDLK